MRRLFASSFIMAAVISGALGDSSTAAQAQPSTLEVQRANAVALFDVRLNSLSALRTAVIDDWNKYERGCQGKATTGRGISVVFQRSELVWFAHTFELDNETTPTCRMLATGITTRSQHIARELEQIDEAARRRAIYPGVMRGLKRLHGFE